MSGIIKEPLSKIKHSKDMIGEFSFNDIGQGGFYTGHLFPISMHYPEMSFAFDCGTLSERDNLNNRIHGFKNSLFLNKLDVLFISHIDDDHVNGIAELLSGITCNRIYLPYLTPIERLFVAVRHGRNDCADFNIYMDFLKSPHNFLLNSENSDIHKIIYIKGNSEQSIEPLPVSDKPFVSEDSNPELTDNLLLDSDSSEYFPKNVEFRKGNGTLCYSRIWEFYLFHEPAEKVEINSFVEKINELFSLNISDSLSQEQLVNILDDKKKLKELRDLYKEKFKNLNKACLIVQHKPLSYKYGQIYKYQMPSSIKHYFNCEDQCNRRHYFSSRTNINNNWGVSLLTGDIGLIQIENSDYIKRHLDKVIVFQIPHHGSQTGWDNSKLKLLNNKGKTTSVICFGFGNNYGHPKQQVLDDLLYENFDVKFCNQYDNFSYSFRLKY
jgi:hypothetical protein